MTKASEEGQNWVVQPFEDGLHRCKAHTGGYKHDKPKKMLYKRSGRRQMLKMHITHASLQMMLYKISGHECCSKCSLHMKCQQTKVVEKKSLAQSRNNVQVWQAMFRCNWSATNQHATPNLHTHCAFMSLTHLERIQKSASCRGTLNTTGQTTTHCKISEKSCT